MDAEDVATVNAHDGEPSMLSTQDKLMWISRKLADGGRDPGDAVPFSELVAVIEHAQLPHEVFAKVLAELSGAVRWGPDGAAGPTYGSRS